MSPAFRGYYFVPKHITCCSTIFAYITSVHLGMSLNAVMCIGVTVGAYILTLFAMKYRQRVLGLILVSPLCEEPSWSEWLYNKVPFLCLKDEIPKLQFNMFRDGMAMYSLLSEGLRKLHCRSLIFVGDMSPFHSEALHITSKLDRRFSVS